MQRYLSVAHIELASTVVVFDLDDTLYFESSYRLSGINAVLQYVRHLFGNAALDGLSVYDLQLTNVDFIARLTETLNCPDSVKQSLLWVYRLHFPDIVLREGMMSLIGKLESACAKVAILTDGRSVSQRQKLRALGLERFPVYISEEYSSEKPNGLRYQKIMDEFHAKRYVYIADNPVKDFLAPNALGWRTVGLYGAGGNVHSQSFEELSKEFHPHIWVSHADEVMDKLC